MKVKLIDRNDNTHANLTKKIKRRLIINVKMSTLGKRLGEIFLSEEGGLKRSC